MHFGKIYQIRLNGKLYFYKINYKKKRMEIRNFLTDQKYTILLEFNDVFKSGKERAIANLFDHVQFKMV